LEDLDTEHWEHIERPRAEFPNLLTSTRSLKSLELSRVPLLMSISTLPSVTLWLKNALRSNTSIERLVLTHASATIVQSLVSHPNLRELVLRSFEGPVKSALAELLSITKSLDLLDLAYIRLTGEGMQTLVEGLQANLSLTRLLFDPWSGFPYTDATFSNYMQSAVAPPHGLRELGYGGNIDSLAEAMVRTPQQDLSTYTVGSALQKLWLSVPVFNDHNVANFPRSFSSHAVMIHLTHLNLYRLDSSSLSALSRCVPNLVHLHELNVESITLEAKQLLPELVRSVKTNGCLHKVSVPMTVVNRCGRSSSGPPALTRKEELLLKSYCRRNEETTRLLAKVSDSTHGSGDENAQNIWLFPSLFGATIAARKTAPNVLFLGLLSLPVSMMSCHDGKRSRR
jgi:hypothetical protein